MAGTDVFNAAIRAIDQASGPIAAVAAKMRGLIGLQHKSTEASKEAAAAGGRSFAALSAHVNLLRGHFGGLNATIGRVRGSLSEFLPMLGALGAGSSLAGMFALVDKTATGAAKGAADAAKIGGSAGPYKFAAKMTGVDPDAVVPGIEKLEKAMSLAVAGKNKDVAAMFKHLGVSMTDANGKVRSFAEIMPQLADALKNTTDPAMRVRAATALFGKAGVDLIPMLIQGSAALKAYAEEGKKLGYVATDEEKAGLKDYHEQMLRLGAATSGFATAIGSKLAPVLAPVVAKVVELVAANKDWMASYVADKVRELAHWLSMLHLGELIDRVRAVTSVMISFGSTTGGLASIIGGITLVLGSPLIGAVANLLGIFGKLITVLRALALLVWANPIVLAVAAVVAAAYLLWKYWEPIKDFFADLWKSVVASFQNAWTYIQPIVAKITGAVSAIRNGWVGRQLGLEEGAPAPARAPPPVSPYSPGSPAAPSIVQGGAPPAQVEGQVAVRVDFANAPPGTRVQTNSSGAAARPDINVGFANPAFAY